MLAAARDDEIRTISQIPYQANVDGGDRGVHDSQMQAANAIIEEASRIGLIEPNQNETKESRKVYRIKGGTAKLKEFIMNTT
jgi:ribosomal protein S20